MDAKKGYKCDMIVGIAADGAARQGLFGTPKIDLSVIVRMAMSLAEVFNENNKRINKSAVEKFALDAFKKALSKNGIRYSETISSYTLPEYDFAHSIVYDAGNILTERFDNEFYKVIERDFFDFY